MKEIWKDVKEYEGYYQVSNLGRIRSVFRYKKVLKMFHNKDNGYVYAILYKNKREKCCRVHRLVAQAFIENSLNKPFVNHKDGNKENNCVDNLEWCTVKENTQHAIKNGLLKIPKGEENHMYRKYGDKHWNSKKVINIDTGKIYNSFGEIARELNITNASNIVANCKGKKKSAYGYHWQYLDNY